MMGSLLSRNRAVLEFLEGRRLLAASLSAGVLTVNGDDVSLFPNDTITLQRVLNNGQYKIQVRITPGLGSTSEFWFLYSDVDTVNVNTGGGTNRAEWLSGLGKPTTMRGGPLADTLIGGSEDDYLIGDTGNDSLVGNDGDDSLDASGGNDTMSGQGGADIFMGGNQVDTIDYSDQGNAVFVTLDDVADDGLYLGGSPPSSAEGDNAATSNERVKGTSAFYGDYIVGNGKDNIIWGLGSNDTLIGYGGADLIYGGDGNDYIDGGSDDDALLGEAGQDTVYGSGGNDNLLTSLDGSPDTLSGGGGLLDIGVWDIGVDTVLDSIPG